jgi:serine O-acetyltransferase
MLALLKNSWTVATRTLPCKDRRILKDFADEVRALCYIPLLIPYVVTSSRPILQEDVQRWIERLGGPRRILIPPVLRLLGSYPEFRSLYFHRLRYGNLPGALLSIGLGVLYKSQTALYLECPEIGAGLFLQHAFSTIIGAKSIGRNCWINQQVTIGFKDDSHGPIIGDGVTINAGAKVIGPIRVGNNVTIGANAVVVKDVPDDCVVVGIPAYIVRRRGVKVNEPL